MSDINDANVVNFFAKKQQDAIAQIDEDDCISRKEIEIATAGGATEPQAIFLIGNFGIAPTAVGKLSTDAASELISAMEGLMGRWDESWACYKLLQQQVNEGVDARAAIEACKLPPPPYHYKGYRAELEIIHSGSSDGHEWAKHTVRLFDESGAVLKEFSTTQQYSLQLPGPSSGDSNQAFQDAHRWILEQRQS